MVARISNQKQKRTPMFQQRVSIDSKANKVSVRERERQEGVDDALSDAKAGV